MTLIDFYEFGMKDTLRLSGLPDPALHLLIGVALFLLLGAGLRRPLASPLPLGIVAAIELLNECADRVRWGSWLGWASVEDVAVTLTLPASIVLFAMLRARSHARPALA